MGTEVYIHILHNLPYEFLGFDAGQTRTSIDKRWQGDSLHELSCGELLETRVYCPRALVKAKALIFAGGPPVCQQSAYVWCFRVILIKKVDQSISQSVNERTEFEYAQR